MKQRIITAILAIVVFLPFVIYGGLPFALFVYVIATIGLMELMAMHKIAKYSVPSVLSIGLLWVVLSDDTEIILYTWFSQTEIIMLGVLLLLSYTVLVKNKFTFDDAGFALLAVIYVGTGFYYLIETRDTDLSYVFFALFIVWATDTGAYFFGQAFGRKKLWPMISPNKTVEGALGGILLACIVAVIFQIADPLPSSMLVVIGATILASVFGQIGDLVESAFKRHYGVKDSGNILPGHGGILDRFDSLLFVLPLLHFIGFIQ